MQANVRIDHRTLPTLLNCVVNTVEVSCSSCSRVPAPTKWFYSGLRGRILASSARFAMNEPSCPFPRSAPRAIGLLDRSPQAPRFHNRLDPCRIHVSLRRRGPSRCSNVFRPRALQIYLLWKIHNTEKNLDAVCGSDILCLQKTVNAPNSFVL